MAFTVGVAVQDQVMQEENCDRTCYKNGVSDG